MLLATLVCLYTAANKKVSSRLIISLSSLLTQVSFHEHLGLFASQSRQLFSEARPTSAAAQASLLQQLADLLELVYAHSVRFLKLNQRPSAEIWAEEADSERLKQKRPKPDMYICLVFVFAKHLQKWKSS